MRFKVFFVVHFVLFLIQVVYLLVGLLEVDLFFVGHVLPGLRQFLFEPLLDFAL